jgi:hypothetical protein
VGEESRSEVFKVTRGNCAEKETDMIIEPSSWLFWVGIFAAIVGGIFCGLLGVYIMLGKRIKN